MAEKPLVVLVGSDSPAGRDIRDIVSEAGLGISLRLVSENEESSGALTAVGDEPSVVSLLGADSLAGGARVALLAGSEASTARALELLDEEPGAIAIDLGGVAEDRPDARLRAPAVESETEEAEGCVHVVAHPAAIALALFLRRLQTNDPIRRSVIQVLAPATEYGPPGLNELQKQTIGLLSFKPLPKAVFDEQVAFNLLPRLGERAPVSLEQSELRIERHLATLLALPGDGEGAPMPSLRVAQAPVFHGYSFSAWVEFEGNPGVEALESGLASEWIDVRGPDTAPPSNVGQAGQGGISVGAIAEDRNNPDACWFWLACDNARLAAENAVAVMRQLV